MISLLMVSCGLSIVWFGSKGIFDLTTSLLLITSSYGNSCKDGLYTICTDLSHQRAISGEDFQRANVIGFGINNQGSKKVYNFSPCSTRGIITHE